MQEDQQLIEKILTGNQAITKVLYDRYEAHWFRLCLRYGRNRAEAQDIFQEGVVNVFNNLNKYQFEKGRFSTWSNKVIINAALRYLKKHNWQQSFVDLEKVTETADWSENILGEITAKELIQVIQQLPSGYRVIFNMHEMEGYSHKEIAEALNISIGTSKSQLSKAKKALQQQLKILF